MVLRPSKHVKQRNARHVPRFKGPLGKKFLKSIIKIWSIAPYNFGKILTELSNSCLQFARKLPFGYLLACFLWFWAMFCVSSFFYVILYYFVDKTVNVKSYVLLMYTEVWSRLLISVSVCSLIIDTDDWSKWICSQNLVKDYITYFLMNISLYLALI